MDENNANTPKSVTFVALKLIDFKHRQLRPKAAREAFVIRGQFAMFKWLNRRQFCAIVSMHESSTKTHRLRKIEWRFLQLRAKFDIPLLVISSLGLLFELRSILDKFLQTAEILSSDKSVRTRHSLNSRHRVVSLRNLN